MTEPKTERVQLLMTPKELEAVDDWSFRHRVRGRSEAIRQLLQAGLSQMHDGFPMFFSDATKRYAFSSDPRGSNLPAGFGPWRVVPGGYLPASLSAKLNATNDEIRSIVQEQGVWVGQPTSV